MTGIELGLLFGAIAALGNLMGGLVLTLKREWEARFLRYFIGIGAGFMLAAVLLKILPESIDLLKNAEKAGLLVLVGYLLVHFSEHIIASHFHFGEETHSEALVKSSTGFWAVIGLAVHAFFDGVSITSGFLVNSSLGLLIFLAVILHKLPEGFTVSSITLASGRSKRTAIAGALGVGLSTMLGAILMSPMRQYVSYSLALSAGVTLYVAASDLIPEANEEKGIKMASVVFSGIAFYYITERILSSIGLH